MLAALWAYDGWNNMPMVAGEVQQPGRNVPRALIFGMLVMLLEAFLSFLGLGVQAPLASWGSLAADGIQNIAIFPWQLLCPGITMAVTLFSLNFLGDGLRDALDPQMRKS